MLQSGGLLRDLKVRETVRLVAAMHRAPVRNYLSSAMGKTGARPRAEAVLVAERRGWL